MNIRLTAAVYACFLIVAVSCRGEMKRETVSSDKTVDLYAGKGVYVELEYPGKEFGDSLVVRNGFNVELVLKSRDGTVTLSAFLAEGGGEGAAGRLKSLEEDGIRSADTIKVFSPGGAGNFIAIVYDTDEACFAERDWNRGGGELVVLSMRSADVSSNTLLTRYSGLLGRARISGPDSGLARTVYLSDRSMDEIVSEANADVDPPPSVHHDLYLAVCPSFRRMTVLDTLEIDFRATQADSRLAMMFPRGEEGTGFQVLAGSMEDLGDSILCVGDSNRIFRGVYSGSWNGFTSLGKDTMITGGMRLDRAMSFQCGMWFYPGCGFPASYDCEVAVPREPGYDVYVPMRQTDKIFRDSVLVVSFASPDGGITGPLAWAVGNFGYRPMASGAGVLVYSGSPDETEELAAVADELARSVWNVIGFEGARLDIVLVSVLDMPVLLGGSGCLFISKDMLEAIDDRDEWADSIAAGKEVPGTAVVFEAAKALLSRSTFLSPVLDDALAAWTTLRFTAGDDADRMKLLLEALEKYYLYATQLAGGTEYALADQFLEASDSYEPVVLGKGPVVLEFLSAEIPSFERAVPRALASLRHSGDSFGRLLSAMGISGSGRYGELYLSWMYRPGVPVLRVDWAEESGILELHPEQFQPGPDFPLGSILRTVAVRRETGWKRYSLSDRGGGRFMAGVGDFPGRILSVDIDPVGILPGDVVYRRKPWMLSEGGGS